jgi:hypothetical protein
MNEFSLALLIVTLLILEGLVLLLIAELVDDTDDTCKRS